MTRLLDDLALRDGLAALLGPAFAPDSLRDALRDADWGPWEDRSWLGVLESKTGEGVTQEASTCDDLLRSVLQGTTVAQRFTPAPYQWAALIYLTAWMRLARAIRERGATSDLDKAVLQAWRDLAASAPNESPSEALNFGDTPSPRASMWMATGSGKTLITHASLLLAQKVLFPETGFPEVVLLCPDQGLADQHAQELALSGFEVVNGHDSHAPQGTVRVLRLDEFTRGNNSGDVQRRLTSLPSGRLVLFDEGHVGTGAPGEAKNDSFAREIATHLSTGGGALLEFSATYGHISPRSRKARYDGYRHSIPFAYDYSAFHGDGYGKDFVLLSTDSGSGDAAQRSLALDAVLASLLVTAAQRRAAETLEVGAAVLRIQPSLSLLLGATVSDKDKDVEEGNSSDETTGSTKLSDVNVLISCLAWVAHPANKAELDRRLRHITSNLDSWAAIAEPETAGSRTSSVLEGLVTDVLGGDLAAAVRYLLADASHLALAPTVERGGAPCKDEFHLLADGKPDVPIAVIKVGDSYDASGLLSVLLENDRSVPGIGKVALTRHETSVPVPALLVEDGDLKLLDAPNVAALIGANKFARGWDSPRPSTMVLLNKGKTDGSQLRQMFGRGVRLEGRGGSRKREHVALPPEPEARKEWLAQTLFTFGVNATALRNLHVALEREERASYFLRQNDHHIQNDADLQRTAHALLVPSVDLIDPRRRATPEVVLDASLTRALLEARAPAPYEERAVDRHVIAGILLSETPDGREVSTFDSTVTDVAHLRGLVSRDRLRRDVRAWIDARRSNEATNVEGAWWRRITVTDKAINEFHATAAVKISREGVDGFAARTTDDVEVLHQAFLSGLQDIVKRAQKGQTKADSYRWTPYKNWRVPPRPFVVPEQTINYVVRSDRAGTSVEELKELPGLEGVGNCHLLYRPLLVAAPFTNEVLEPSELGFLRDVSRVWSSESAHWTREGWRLFILRNPANSYVSTVTSGKKPGKANRPEGQGLPLETGGMYYPDFIMWLVDPDGRQAVIVVDPKGVFTSGVSDELAAKMAAHGSLAKLREHPDSPPLHAYISATYFGQTTPSRGGESMERQVLRTLRAMLPPRENRATDEQELVRELLTHDTHRSVLQPLRKGKYPAGMSPSVYAQAAISFGRPPEPEGTVAALHSYASAMLWSARYDLGAAVNPTGLP